MKKVIFALAAVVAFAACSNEETIVRQDREAIDFNGAFVENTVRSIDPSITTGTISSFTVYGTTQGDEKNANDEVIAPVVNIYNGVVVTKDVVENGIGKADSWWYAGDHVQYWIEGNTYNFAAVVNGTVATDATGMPETISYTADGVTDLLYAEYTTTGQKTGNATVGFTFDHLLSKVKFTFKNTSAAGSNDNYTYKVTGLQITGTPASGEYTVANYLTSNDAWTTRTDSATTTYGHIVDKDEIADAAVAIEVAPGAYGVSNYERLVIPGEYTINVQCRIALLYNDEEVDVTNYNKDVDVAFADGCAYNLVLSGSVGEQIMFTCTEVKGWDETNSNQTL